MKRRGTARSVSSTKIGRARRFLFNAATVLALVVFIYVLSGIVFACLIRRDYIGVNSPCVGPLMTIYAPIDYLYEKFPLVQTILDWVIDTFSKTAPKK